MHYHPHVSGPREHHHAVQIYADVRELAQSVAAFFSAGLADGAPAVLIAAAAHEPVYREELERLGWDVEQLLSDGLLVTRDAERTLTTFVRDDYPSSAPFDDVVGGLIDDVSAQFPDALPRAFGEMVDVLSRRGCHDAAVSLEELWNSLAWSRRFLLLCGYELDVFDPELQRTVLPEICRTHTHVTPAGDSHRLAAAVDSALERILGAEEADRVAGLVAEQHDERVPPAQRTLMWVSTYLPGEADEILAAARADYARP
jgi:MEDS: MEthanogen/methylotroph, DcmR Sensory domain